MKKRKRAWIAAAAIGIADIVLMCVLIGLFLGREGEEIIRDPHAVPSLQGEMSESERLQAISDAMRHIYYNPEPVLAAGQLDVQLSNGEESGYMLSAEIVRLENGEMIGEIGLIDPGYWLEKMDCGAQLPAGEHECLMTIYLYKMDGTYIGKAGRFLKLAAK